MRTTLTDRQWEAIKAWKADVRAGLHPDLSICFVKGTMEMNKKLKVPGAAQNKLPPKGKPPQTQMPCKKKAN